MELDKKQHWETVYETKAPHEVSWTQETPQTSLDFIASFPLDKSARIIDIGGGDSKLVDHLLDLGYTNISVLDISEKALEKAKQRLGDKAHKVNWIVSDVTDFEPSSNFDIWHDRAAFHFLRTEEEIQKYLTILRNYVKGYVVMGTFSDQGPLKCSGLEITQYSESTMTERLSDGFEKLKCITLEHTTPFETQQHFLFCSFKKMAPQPS
jgi:SAM-dependent methyltransferase